MATKNYRQASSKSLTTCFEVDRKIILKVEQEIIESSGRRDATPRTKLDRTTNFKVFDKSVPLILLAVWNLFVFTLILL